MRAATRWVMLTGEVEEILIRHPEPVEVLEVDITQPLEVEGAPGDKEEDDNTHCKDRHPSLRFKRRLNEGSLFAALLSTHPAS